MSRRKRQPRTAAERQRARTERQRRAGAVRVTLYLQPEALAALATLAGDGESRQDAVNRIICEAAARSPGLRRAVT